MAYFIACSLALESFKTLYYALRLKTSHNILFQLNCTSKTGFKGFLAVARVYCCVKAAR